MKVNEALRRFRKELGLRQQDVADFLEINVKTYQFYEYGKVNIPVNSVLKLADEYNLSTDYLLGRVDIDKARAVDYSKLIKALKVCFEASKPIVEIMQDWVFGLV